MFNSSQRCFFVMRFIRFFISFEKKITIFVVVILFYCYNIIKKLWALAFEKKFFAVLWFALSWNTQNFIVWFPLPLYEWDIQCLKRVQKRFLRRREMNLLEERIIESFSLKICRIICNFTFSQIGNRNIAVIFCCKLFYF